MNKLSNISAFAFDLPTLSMGNPLYYYNGTDYNFTWIGRRMLSATTSGKTYSFTYDDAGMRTSKARHGGATTTYYYDGTTLIAEETAGAITVYLYDSTGSPVGMKYRTSFHAYNTWDTYCFEKNLQGDIIGVYSNTGTKLITYTYDPWGEFNTTYYNGGANTSAVNNNLRYRGYYYDSDLQLYYLISRYYDSNTGRFISPDIPETITLTRMSLADKNLYAYCDNNPIMRSDDGGDFWHILAGAAIGFVAGIVTNVVEQVTNPDNEFSVGEMLLSATIGGGMGALTATGVPMYAVVAASAGSAFVESTITGFIDKYDDDPSNKDATVGDIFLDATIDAGISALFTAASYTGDGKNMKSLYVASKNASARFTGTVHPRVNSQIAGTVKTYYKQLGREIVSDIKDTTTFGAGQFVIDYLADKLF